ncbi:MAG: Nif3-like dinuclear metal center hexameric protein [Bacteroidales bacterium]|nr:Nif3-like dinuclear metal center hexameric protein [Bacteroidales bacterium]
MAGNIKTAMEYKVKDMTAVIEQFAPLSLQEGWDNSGLCIGSPEAPVTSVLLGLDCTPELVDEAISCGADMIVTHHPLIFSGLKKISPDNPVGEAVIKAIKAGISIYAAHTSADKVIAGVSGAMAARLGLENVHILDEDGEGTGLGVVGDLPEPISAEEAVALVKERFSLKAMRASRPVEGKISRIAMCGGSGGSLIGAAEKSGAQLYISGDISYHNFFTREGFMIMDIGHYESEIEIVDILFSLLKKNFPTFAVRITQNIYSNPIFYF